jgi:hypothetical protein
MQGGAYNSEIYMELLDSLTLAMVILQFHLHHLRERP